jgi:oxygen-independent coproporphyrinogen-3 oxidase
VNASDRSRTRRSTASTSRSCQDAAESRDAPTSLYVHVPFCLKRCAYCDFATAPYDADSAERYVRRLADELERVPRASPLRTIYLGGGTPTALTERQLEFVLERVRERVALPKVGGSLVEWTCEANPESLTREKAKLLRDAGVDRVSLGAQSFEEPVLAALGRDHAPKHVFAALELLRDAGFERLSLDLMFAAPGETSAQLERDLEQLAKLELEHVSAYCLTYEPGTPLTRLRAEGRVTPHDDETELVQYRLVRERLAAAGLAHYEISNFARPGRESQHNLVYWRGEEYFGVGLGAGSYEFGTRRSSTRELSKYLGEWGSADSRDWLGPPHEAETLEPDAKAREALILGLRLLEGVDSREFAHRFGSCLDEPNLAATISRLVARGLLERLGAVLRLTPRGLELADEVFVELV